MTVFLNVPGEPNGAGRQHGWPFTYLVRVVPPKPNPPGAICVLRVTEVPSTWALSKDVARFLPAWLAANAGVALAIGLVTSTVFECWRRRHASLASFSLRTAFLAMAVAAACFAWIHHRFARWDRQKPAVARLEPNASITYDSLLPAWLRETLSDDLGRPFDTLHSVHYVGPEISEVDLQDVSELPDLRRLSLSFTEVSDANLAHLAPLTNLEYLSLSNTAVTDQGLVHLTGHAHLETLDLRDTQVAGPGLVHLKGLAQLVELNLEGTPLADEGLVHLLDLPNLRQVKTYGARISRVGAIHFGERSRHHLRIDFDGFVDP